MQTNTATTKSNRTMLTSPRETSISAHLVTSVAITMTMGDLRTFAYIMAKGRQDIPTLSNHEIQLIDELTETISPYLD